MNKTELTNAVAEKTGVSKKDVAQVVSSVVETITAELAKGESVQLVGFGTFSVSEKKAREGRNPKTGETMHIDACNTPKFKAGKSLKDAVNA